MRSSGHPLEHFLAGFPSVDEGVASAAWDLSEDEILRLLAFGDQARIDAAADRLNREAAEISEYVSWPGPPAPSEPSGSSTHADAGGQDDMHRVRDSEKLLLHERVAVHLQEDPQRVLAIARGNMERWLTLGSSEEPYLLEWQRILDSTPVEDLVALIVADTEDARRLRQSTPFVGVLSVAERNEVLAAARVVRHGYS